MYLIVYHKKGYIVIIHSINKNLWILSLTTEDLKIVKIQIKYEINKMEKYSILKKFLVFPHSFSVLPEIRSY